MLKPIKNNIYQLLEELKYYKVHLRDLKEEITKSKIQIPDDLKQLRIIIEYSDLIIQAQDMLNFQVLIKDHDWEREGNEEFSVGMSGKNPRSKTFSIATKASSLG